MKIPVQYQEGKDFLEPNKVYVGNIANVELVDNHFYEPEKQDEIYKKQLKLAIEAVGSEAVGFYYCSPIVSNRSNLGKILIALGVEIKEGLTEITDDILKSGKFKFTTCNGKPMTNQETGEEKKDSNGRTIYFSKIDKFYSLDESPIIEQTEPKEEKSKDSNEPF